MNKTQQNLILDNLGVAIKVLQMLKIKGPSYEDAKAEAMLILCKAAEAYVPNKGTKFSTWAWIKVEGGLKDWMRKEKRRSTISDSLKSLDDEDSTQSYSLFSDNVPADEQTYQNMVSNLIDSSLSKAPLSVQTVANLSLLSDNTVMETASKMGVGRDTVLRRRKQARTFLLAAKEKLEE